jgi:hypothetical protein
MKKNWVRLLFGLVFSLAAGNFILFVFQTQKAIHYGQSPAIAFQTSQQKFWHILLNPWIFTTYLLVLVVLLWNTVRAIVRKQHHPNDLWLAAGFLAAIAVLVLRFIQRH